MKIGVVGSRSRNSEEDYNLVAEALEKLLDKDDVLVSGGCPRGADSFVERLSKTYHLPKPIIHNAEWDLYGDSAGPIRNTLIAKESDVLIACLAKGSRGTKNTIDKFKKYHPNGKLIIV